jgi:hypothetical protein
MKFFLLKLSLLSFDNLDTLNAYPFTLAPKAEKFSVGIFFATLYFGSTSILTSTCYKTEGKTLTLLPLVF